uniref:Uncharacterized protein n=1 Tax=Sipha flava TaxID=143950 RepID=A0A2S2Q583_9HEMI
MNEKRMRVTELRARFVSARIRNPPSATLPHRTSSAVYAPPPQKLPPPQVRILKNRCCCFFDSPLRRNRFPNTMSPSRPCTCGALVSNASHYSRNEHNGRRARGMQEGRRSQKCKPK